MSCSCTFSVFLNNKQKMCSGTCTSPTPHKIHIYWYVLDIKHFYQISWWLSQVPLEAPQTSWNNPISHRFIIILSDVIPVTKARSHYYADDAWTSNACHGHNFHRRDLKFSDIVPNTITIFNHNYKKKR